MTYVLVGVLVGLVQGVIFKPIYRGLFRWSVHLLSGMVSSANALLVVGNALSSVGVGCFLLLPLALTTSDSRNTLLIGWFVGFCLGALMQTILSRDGKKSTPIR